MCAQSCLTFCNFIDCSQPGFSVHGIFQARILEWVTISFSRESPQPRNRTHISSVSCIVRQILYQLSHWGRLLDKYQFLNWSWSSDTLATWCEELTHWKRPRFWERLKTGGEGDDRGWDGWMASPARWTWVWASSRSWWWTGKPGVLQSMGLQRVRHDRVTELNEKSDDFTKVNKRTERTGKYVYNFYGFYLKIYNFESVFSRSRENLPLKLIMTVI